MAGEFNNFHRFVLYITTATIIGFGGLFIGLDILNKLKTLEQKLEQPKYEVQTKNVVGGEIPEKFYEIDERRAYLEVDGMSIEQKFKLKKYFKNKPSDLSHLAKY